MSVSKSMAYYMAKIIVINDMVVPGRCRCWWLVIDANAGCLAIDNVMCIVEIAQHLLHLLR